VVGASFEAGRVVIATSAPFMSKASSSSMPRAQFVTAETRRYSVPPLRSTIASVMTRTSAPSEFRVELMSESRPGSEATDARRELDDFAHATALRPAYTSSASARASLSEGAWATARLISAAASIGGRESCRVRRRRARFSFVN
jgi:hypothetical protein